MPSCKERHEPIDWVQFFRCMVIYVQEKVIKMLGVQDHLGHALNISLCQKREHSNNSREVGNKVAINVQQHYSC